MTKRRRNEKLNGNTNVWIEEGRVYTLFDSTEDPPNYLLARREKRVKEKRGLRNQRTLAVGVTREGRWCF